MTNTKQELREKIHIISRDTFWILGSDEQKKDADFRAHVILTAEIEIQKLLSDTVNSEVNKVLDGLDSKAEEIDYLICCLDCNGVDRVREVIEQVRKEYS